MQPTVPSRKGNVFTGYWLVVVCWLLVVGCWLLVVGCWLLIVGCLLLTLLTPPHHPTQSSWANRTEKLASKIVKKHKVKYP